MGMTGVDDSHDSDQPVVLGAAVLDEEGLRYRCRVGKAGGLEQHTVEADLAQGVAYMPAVEEAHQVAPRGAAHSQPLLNSTISSP